MRRVARVVGIAWMVGCVALWLWTEFDQPFNDASVGLLTLPALLSESRLGLTMLPILLGGVGFMLWR